MKRIPIQTEDTLDRHQLEPRVDGDWHPNAHKGLMRWHQRRKELGVHNPTYRDLMTGALPDEDKVPKMNDKKRTVVPLFARRPGMYECIMQLVQDGHHLSTVANAIGIKAQTIMKWLKYGQSGKNKAYLQFLKDFRAAESVAEVNRFNKLKEDGDGDWKSSAWILERRYPERWAKQIDRTTPTQMNITGDKVLVQNQFSAKVIDDVEARDLARGLVSRTMAKVVVED